MKIWLKRLAVLAAFAAILIVAVLAWVEGRVTTAIDHYASNPNLRTIKPDWPGTPADSNGRFINYEYPYKSKLADLLRWQFSVNPFKNAKKNDSERLDVLDPSGFLSGGRDGILWLGHASFLIRLDGVNFLFDPIFGRPPLVRTFVDVPSPIDKLKVVDAVLLSHDHRDHADAETIRQVAQKFPNALLLGGLKTDDIFNDWKTPTNDVQTAGWYQQFDMPTGYPEVYFVPVRHWSRRGLFDTNERLWGGFVLRGKSKTIFFGGDSGYGNHYKEVAELFPKIDYFIVGIGAFEPRWFMAPNHNSPADALQAFVDSGAATMIPMHFGTFDLSDEPPGEPLRQLRTKAAEMRLTERVKVLNINESLDLR